MPLVNLLDLSSSRPRRPSLGVGKRRRGDGWQKGMKGDKMLILLSAQISVLCGLYHVATAMHESIRRGLTSGKAHPWVVSSLQA